MSKSEFFSFASWLFELPQNVIIFSLHKEYNKYSLFFEYFRLIVKYYKVVGILILSETFAIFFQDIFAFVFWTHFQTKQLCSKKSHSTKKVCGAVRNIARIVLNQHTTKKWKCTISVKLHAFNMLFKSCLLSCWFNMIMLLLAHAYLLFLLKLQNTKFLNCFHFSTLACMFIKNNFKIALNITIAKTRLKFKITCSINKKLYCPQWVNEWSICVCS